MPARSCLPHDDSMAAAGARRNSVRVWARCEDIGNENSHDYDEAIHMPKRTLEKVQNQLGAALMRITINYGPELGAEVSACYGALECKRPAIEALTVLCDRLRQLSDLRQDHIEIRPIERMRDNLLFAIDHRDVLTHLKELIDQIASSDGRCYGLMLHGFFKVNYRTGINQKACDMAIDFAQKHQAEPAMIASLQAMRALVDAEADNVIDN